MQNQWKKNEKSRKAKAFTIAVLIHAIFLVALIAFSSTSEGGVSDWVKSQFKQDQTEVAAADSPKS